jgi:hypothetical protein
VVLHQITATQCADRAQHATATDSTNFATQGDLQNNGLSVVSCRYFHENACLEEDFENLYFVFLSVLDAMTRL